MAAFSLGWCRAVSDFSLRRLTGRLRCGNSFLVVEAFSSSRMRENVGDGLHVEREAAYGLWAYEGGIETESKRADRTFRSVRGVNRQFHQKLNPQNPPGLPGGQSVLQISFRYLIRNEADQR